MSTPQLIASLHQLPSMTDRSLMIILRHRLAAEYTHWTAAALEAAGLTNERAASLSAEAKAIDPAAVKLELERQRIHVIPFDDTEYPALLKEIHAAPPVLYVRGDPGVLRQPCLGVVGTRFPSPYGLSAVQRLIPSVAKRGISIVSGLAVGIDAGAHQAALDNDGPTVAVFATGINRVYPAHHRQLATNIINGGGAVVSEFPLGTMVERFHFPRRNRIITGLSRACLIIEAGDRSGALITAKFAVEQNRELLALPGPIDAPTSVGPNNWIRLGATLVRSADDILEAMKIPASAAAEISDPIERQLHDLLGPNPVHIDELTEKSRLDVSLVSAALSLMEIKGLIRHRGGQYYCLVE